MIGLVGWQQLVKSFFFFFFCRALLTQEGICLTLSPEFHFLEVAYPYVARRLLTAEDPMLRERLFQVGCRPSLHDSSLYLVQIWG